MAKLIPSSFCSYELTSEESLRGAVFNQEQRMYLQNILSMKSQELLNLDFTPNDVLSYTQTEAALKGVIRFIQQILDGSDDATVILNSSTN